VNKNLLIQNCAVLAATAIASIFIGWASLFILLAFSWETKV